MENSITEKIKSYEDAANALGLDPNALPDVSMLPENQREALIANYKLWVICQALNEGWKPDWSNYGEYKWYPWFDFTAEDNGSGSSFAYDGFGDGHAISGVGSRLAYKSRDLAKYAGKQFTTLYETVFVLK